MPGRAFSWGLKKTVLVPIRGEAKGGTIIEEVRHYQDGTSEAHVIFDDTKPGTLSWGELRELPEAFTNHPAFGRNVSGAAVPGDFSIGYYASPDTKFADAVLLGRETITASADKTVGTHQATSPSLQFPNGGSFYIFVRLNDQQTVSETDSTNNLIQASQTTSVAVSPPFVLDNG